MMPLSWAPHCGGLQLQNGLELMEGQIEIALPNCFASSENKQNQEKTFMYPDRQTKNDKKQEQMILR